MAFNEANVNSRLRHLVRGRVIIVTDSKVVEFLEESLMHSYPLFNFTDFTADKPLAVFLVEVNGFLTFDEGSFVKISQELDGYQRTWFDPTAFQYVRQADPVVAPAPSAIIFDSFPHSSYYVDELTAFVVNQCTVKYNTGGVVREVVFEFTPVYQQDSLNKVKRIFPNDSVYLGDGGYPGFTRVS